MMFFGLPAFMVVDQREMRMCEKKRARETCIMAMMCEDVCTVYL
jgi:hypothetical protein